MPTSVAALPCTLHAYPDFRFAAHFFGLAARLAARRHPADMELLADMVAAARSSCSVPATLNQCLPPFRIATASASCKPSTTNWLTGPGARRAAPG